MKELLKTNIVIGLIAFAPIKAAESFVKKMELGRMMPIIFRFFIIILITGCTNDQKIKSRINDSSNLIYQVDSIPLNYKGLNLYEGANNTILLTNNETYFLGYNPHSREIDIFSINKLKLIKSVPIPHQGPNSFYGVNYIQIFDNKIYIEDGPYLHVIDLSNQQFTRIEINDRIEYLGRSYFLTTSRFVANFDVFFTIDTIKGILYFPLFPALRKVSAEYWNGKILARALLPELKIEPLDLEFPDLFKQGRDYGEFDRPMTLIKGDSLIYSFCCDPEIYVYNTENKKLEKSAPAKSLKLGTVAEYSKNGLTVFKNTFEHAYTVGNYHPLRYDPYHKIFFRIRRPSRPKGEFLDATKDIDILMVYDEHLKILAQYYLPKFLHYFFHVTPNGLFFQVKESSGSPDEYFRFVLLNFQQSFERK